MCGPWKNQDPAGSEASLPWVTVCGRWVQKRGLAGDLVRVSPTETPGP